MTFSLHLPTLLLLSVFLNVMIGGLFTAVYYLRYRQESFLYWAYACAAFVFGSLLACAHLVGDLPTAFAVIAHVALSLSPVLLLAGIHRLRGLPLLGLGQTVWVLKLASGVYLVALVLSSLKDPAAARLLTALYSAVIFVTALSALEQIRLPPRLPVRLLQLLFGCHSLVMLVQVGAVVLTWWTPGVYQLDALLRPMLISHLLLVTATVLCLPLLAFTQSETRLRQLAELDELTGLLNRRGFFKQGRIAFEKAKRRRQALTVLMIDLDHFKSVNDSWGHAAGDEALRLVARLMGEELRDVDIIGRVGGEEFAAVLVTASEQDVMAVSHRLRQRIEDMGLRIREMDLKLSASIGGAAMTPEAEDFDQLLQTADRALYRAKDNGRNRVEFVI